VDVVTEAERVLKATASQVLRGDCGSSANLMLLEVAGVTLQLWLVLTKLDSPSEIFEAFVLFPRGCGKGTGPEVGRLLHAGVSEVEAQR
jgi:hypothetical protein